MSTIVYLDNWVDAREKNREHPDTFFLPPEHLVQRLRKGWTVKICNGEERFWATVLHIEGEKVIGEVDNWLVGERDYNYESLVQFEKRHIYQIHTKGDLKKIEKEMKKKL